MPCYITAESHFKGLSVLLVEDAIPQQKMMGKWLNGQGYRVTIASNGKIGLELLKTHQFDVCFMDFLMVSTIMLSPRQYHFFYLIF